MNLTEIKKALYKQKPTAILLGDTDENRQYMAKITLEGEEEIIRFKIPWSDMPENLEDNVPAQLLIRWLV